MAYPHGNDDGAARESNWKDLKKEVLPIHDSNRRFSTKPASPLPASSPCTPDDEDELHHQPAPFLLLGAIPRLSPVSKTASFHEILSAIHSASVAIASSSRDPAARLMMTSAVTSPSSSPGGGLHT
jgi:hypothetical protein